MAGYSRQSVADIIANAVIKAAPVNAEFNAIRDAFAFSGGHKHDGSSTEGAYIPLIADVDGNNKVVVDTSNNRISFYTEVSGSPVEQLRIQDGAIVPVTDDDIDIGSSSLKFKDLYIDGVGYFDAIVVSGNFSIGGNLTVSGTSTLNTISSNVTPTTDDTYDLGTSTNEWRNLYVDGTANIDSLAADAAAVTGNTTVGGTLGVTGTTTVSNLTATGNANIAGTATIATVDINAGAIDGTAIGASSAAAGTFTNLTSTGTSTHATVDINGGAIDGTVIGATTKAAGSFTTVTTTGQATLATADINGGTIDGAVIGGASAAAITGTTITGTSLVGPLTGNVTGNVTGNLTGNVTGNVTGNLTGNVTAASGTSSFTDVTINGTLNMNAGTTATITNLTTPTNTNDAATKGYVDTAVANLIDSAPGALDTLNELAAAINDDANFATTVTNSIATKLPLAGGTMSGAIAMGTNKITGMGDPTANQDAATKAYVDTQDATKLSKSGGTMTGAIDMGANKITTTYTPIDAADLTTKTYVDGILGSATAAAASAAAAATSASNAATSETNAANSASSAAASYDSFDDRYLGAKSSGPATDNDGDPLVTGALYFDTTANLMKVYDGSSWVDAGSAVNGTAERNVYTATSGQTSFSVTYDVGFVDVYLNGVKLVAGTDFTATDGLTVVLASGATAGDIVDLVAYGAFNIANTYTQAQADARYVQQTHTGNVNITGTVTADALTVDTNTLHVDAANNRVGIGTTLPSKPLEVSGDARFVTTSGIGLQLHNDSSNQSYIQFSNTVTGETSTSGFQVGIDADEEGLVWHYRSEPIKFATTNTERMRIDSSGNLLVGTTSNPSTIATTAGANGVGVSVDDYIAVSRSSGTTLNLNRTTSDGEIATFRKDGSTVGSIGSYAGNQTYITSLGGGIKFNWYSGTQAAIEPCSTSGAPADNLHDLGGPSARWQDLYLSGVGYVGTTQEGYTALSGTTPSIDADTAGGFALTTSGNTTFTFAAVTSGRSVGFVLKLTAGGTHTITWPASVDWAGGTAPDAPASGETNMLVFTTFDGGTTWYGFQAGAALA